VQRIDADKIGAEDLDLLCKVWTMRVPDRLGLIGVVSSIRTRQFLKSAQIAKTKPLQFAYVGVQTTISPELWAAFVNRLARSDIETVRVVGVIERLIWNWFLIDRPLSADQIASLKSQAEEAARLYDLYPVKDNRGRWMSFGGGDYKDRLNEVCWQIEHLQYQPDPFAPRRPLDAKKAASPPRPNAGVEQPLSSGRVSLKKLPFALPVQSFSAVSSPSISVSLGYRGPRWAKWSSDIDLLWTRHEIWWMRRADTFVKLEIEGLAGKVIDDVQPAGDLLWVSVREGDIWVLNKSGAIAYHIAKPEGLPPAEFALRVYPFEERKACAVGSFGKEFRAWCATVDIAGEKPIVKVFHEAKEVISHTGVEAGHPRGTTTNSTFIPVALIPHTTDDGKKVLYISRDQVGSIYSGGAALVIDLATLAVSEARMPPTKNWQCGDQADCYLSHNGRLMNSWMLEGFQRDFRHPRFPIEGQSFVKLDDCDYLPTMQGWERYDRNDDTYEDLCDPSVPLGRLGRMRFAPSAHYGIVGWDYDPNRSIARAEVYQVCIDNTKPAAAIDSKGNSSNAPKNSAATGDMTRASPSKGEARFAVTQQQKDEIAKRIEQFLAHEPKVPENARTIFSDGLSHLDGWLPLLTPQLCFIDPPEERQGLRWLFDNGKLIRVEPLDTAKLSETYTIWYGDFGEPVLLRRRAALDKGQIDREQKFLASQKSSTAPTPAQVRADAEYKVAMTRFLKDILAH
jgi:hypothetical protein